MIKIGGVSVSIGGLIQLHHPSDGEEEITELTSRGEEELIGVKKQL